MSFILGDITLPEPVSFAREPLEVVAENKLLSGTTKKRKVDTRERFVLEFRGLSQAEVNSILSEYNLQVVRDFSANVNDELVILSTPVHVDVTVREYNDKTPQYREDLILILTEVQG